MGAALQLDDGRYNVGYERLHAAYKIFKPRKVEKPSWDAVALQIVHHALLTRAVSELKNPSTLGICREEDRNLWVVVDKPFNIVPGTLDKSFTEASQICGQRGWTMIKEDELAALGAQIKSTPVHSNLGDQSVWFSGATNDLARFAVWNREKKGWDIYPASENFTFPTLGAFAVLKIPLPQA